jgi:glycosyltransferase involved in cell wall biosynthesis
MSWVGDGGYRSSLEGLSRRMGMGERVRFLGRLQAGSPVRQVLDSGDLFVLPSLCEGLPRALIEAMARGLPCIGTDVGGIPELLPPEALVRAGDPHALASKIREIILNPELANRLACQNLARSRDFAEPVLAERRSAFYAAVRQTALQHSGRGAVPVSG